MGCYPFFFFRMVYFLFVRAQREALRSVIQTVIPGRTDTSDYYNCRCRAYEIVLKTFNIQRILRVVHNVSFYSNHIEHTEIKTHCHQKSRVPP